MTTDTMTKLLGIVLIIVAVYRMVEDYKETGMLFRMGFVVSFIVGIVALVL